MSTKPTTWYPGACPVCGGSLHDDLEDRGWATCILCVRTFPIADIIDGEQTGRAPVWWVPELRAAGRCG